LHRLVELDKSDDVGLGLVRGLRGKVMMSGTLAHIDCTVHSVHDGGDHFVVFGAVHSLSEVPKKKPRPLLFYRGEYTGIEPDKNSPAQWRDDLDAFLTTTTTDTWL
jgi:3-hydroxy-9,10-secoandrosta-1,3,5(10)-triene-9,17-dione monooxygenase reductase component